MVVVDSLCQSLAQIAPLRLAEDWDNVGLLVGDRRAQVTHVMTCLTISPNVVDEAIAKGVDLIVVHHPLPFRSLQKITSDTIAGAMLLRLIESKIAIYSAHTAFDSASAGINQSWADQLGLQSVQPLVVHHDAATAETVADAEPTPVEGSGRYGRLAQPTTLGELVQQAATLVGVAAPRQVGRSNAPVRKVAVACGSGGSFLAAAKRTGCDAMITGEATFHTCLEAESLGIGLALLGHYGSERFAMEQLSEQLSDEFTELTIWPSRSERDPIVAAGS